MKGEIPPFTPLCVGVSVNILTDTPTQRCVMVLSASVVRDTCGPAGINQI